MFGEHARILAALESGMCAAPQIAEPNATAAGSLLAPRLLKSRSALRAHLLEELPGWKFWLDCTARLVRESAHDRTILLSDEEVLEDLEHLVTGWVQALGDDAELLFRPLTRKFGLNLRSGVPYRAAGPFTRNVFDAEGTRTTAAFARSVVSWAQLRKIFNRRKAWPSPLLIQLLGAYGLSVLERRRGPKGDPRRALAVDHVVKHLGPFITGQRHAGKRVYPQIYGDPRVAPETAREKPVSLALAARVAIYIAAPGKEDLEYAGKRGGPRQDADVLETAPTAVRQLEDAIRQRLRSRRK